MADEIPGDVTAAVAEVASSSLRSTTGRLVQSFAVYGAANFGIRALNFLLIVVYAHYLRPYGLRDHLSWRRSTHAFLIMFGDLSIDSALQRLYFQHNNDQEELRSYLAIGDSFRDHRLDGGLGCVLRLVAGGRIQRRLRVQSGGAVLPLYGDGDRRRRQHTQGIQCRLAVYQAERRPTLLCVAVLLVRLPHRRLLRLWSC